MTASLRWLASLAILLTSSVEVADAGRRARVCRATCSPRIAACEAAAARFGTLGSRCANAVVQQCLRDGDASCAGAVTTTTTSSTTTTSIPVEGALLETGQTGCWLANGATIDCAGTGQDGELRRGLARAYVDNGDGTITDARAGLVWERLSDDGSIHDWDDEYVLQQGIAVKVATLNATAFAGYTDWRMPNVVELRSLIDYGATEPVVASVFDAGCVPGCTVLQCSCTPHGYHWSSTTSVGLTNYAWWIPFRYAYDGRPAGSPRADDKFSEGRVRAVRGGILQ